MDEIMKEDIRKACEVMQKGGVILYPTDTIWGIGCDATNAEAVKRVYEIKKRSDSKAMLVLVDNAVKVDFYVDGAPEVAFDLIELTNKPLTIIYDGDDKYNKFNTSAILYESGIKLASALSIMVSNIRVGDDAVITVSVTDKATGNITITVGDNVLSKETIDLLGNIFFH